MSLAVTSHRGLCRPPFASNHCYTCAPEGDKMMRRFLVLFCTFTAGAIVGHFGISSIGSHLGELNVVFAQTHKPLMITHLYTGPDNQTHAEEVELKFTPGNPAEVSKMMPITSAELHRTAGGRVDDWHRAPRRQYVITLSGHGEVEVAGAEDRVTLQLPLADQSGR